MGFAEFSQSSPWQLPHAVTQVSPFFRSMEDASIKRKERVQTFEDLLPKTKIGNNTVTINPTILFSRLTALANFQSNVSENFCYELTPEPTSLFKQGMM